MSEFDKAVEVENIAEAELAEAYAEKDGLIKELASIEGGTRLQALKVAMAASENIELGIVEEYRILLNNINDIKKAISIWDRTIILLETGFDPGEKVENITDLDIPEFKGEEE